MESVAKIFQSSGHNYTQQEEVEKCSICLEEMLRSMKIDSLPCGHLFHAECLRTWLTRMVTCPYCRRFVGYNAQASTSVRAFGQRFYCACFIPSSDD